MSGSGGCPMSPSRPTVRVPSVGAPDPPPLVELGVPELQPARPRVSAAPTARTPVRMRESRMFTGDSFFRWTAEADERCCSGYSFGGDSRVGDGLQQVDGDVGQDLDGTQDQRHPGDWREVGDRDRGGQVVADTGPGE